MKRMGKAIFKFISGLVLAGTLLFLPAKTLAFPRAWLLLGLLFVPMFVAGIFLFFRAPALLEKRLQINEKEPEQKVVILLSALEFSVCFVLAGLDYRTSYSQIPLWVTVAASVVFSAAYLLYAEVLRENAYLSRIVEIQENQTVIDTGLYSLVRHPMYFSVVLLFWSMPLVLGSLPAFLVMLPFPLLLVKRIKNEETLLRAGLEGYEDYCKRVRFRLIPFLW